MIVFYFSLERPPSPLLKSSVFVLCIVIKNEIRAVGTAFIVSNNYMLTACHNLVAYGIRKKQKWLAIAKLERVNNVVQPSRGSLQIELVKHKCSPNDDWAILKRADSFQFDASKIVRICPNHHVPSEETEEKMKIYHCPVDIFNSGQINSLGPLSKEERIGNITGHRILVETSLFGGSSGGLFALMNGQAIGMHLASLNSARTIEEVGEEDPNADELFVLQEVIYSLLASYGALSEGIIIPRFKNLMKVIESDI
jgi:hypothetical protein